MSKTDFFGLIKPFVLSVLKLILAAEKQGIKSFDTEYADVHVSYNREAREIRVNLSNRPD